MSILPAVAAAVIAAQNARRRAEERRKAEDERRRRQQREEEGRRRRREEDESRRRKEDRRLREDRIKKHREEERKRIQNGNSGIKIQEDYSFTGVLTIEKDTFPACILYDGYEQKLADGSSLVEIQVNEYSYDKYKIHRLANGVKRVYYGNNLVCEELPDGRVRAYNEGQLTYERDSDGNYKCYELKEGESAVVAEGKEDDGTKAAEFSPTLEINIADLPRKAWFDGYECRLVDGSVITDTKIGSGYNSQCCKTHVLADGTKRIYTYAGREKLNLIYEELPDGRAKKYYNGQVMYERDAEGSYKRYGFLKNEIVLTEEGDQNGKLRSYEYEYGYVTVRENTPQQEFVVCDIQGNIIKEGNKTSYTVYYPDGSQKEEKTADGTIRKWYENGQMAEERFADMSGIKWNESGQKIREDYSPYEFATWYDNGGCRTLHKGGIEAEWNEDGQKIREKTKEGTTFRWYDDGSLKERCDRDGTLHSFYPDGSKKEERAADGTFHSFDTQGRLTAEGNGRQRTTYEYYGETQNKRHIRRYDSSGKEISYTHYNPKGVEDTETYLAMRAVAAERIAKEERLSKRLDGKRKILPKMGKAAKAVAMYKSMQRIKKQK